MTRDKLSKHPGAAPVTDASAGFHFACEKALVRIKFAAARRNFFFISGIKQPSELARKF
jgi:hypothetical protein